ncbi:MAG: hypothetical protein L3J13_00175 [Devosiaceae bacterium]|nr:hypothetical protein [Devosiaceae bacterium]
MPKTLMKKIGVVLPEIAQHPEIRAVQPRDIHERKILVTPFFYLPRAENSVAVSVNKDRNNQPGMIGVLPIRAVLALQTGGVKLGEYILIQITFVVAGKQIKNIGREQQPLINLYRAFFKWNRHQITSLFLLPPLYHKNEKMSSFFITFIQNYRYLSTKIIIGTTKRHHELLNSKTAVGVLGQAPRLTIFLYKKKDTMTARDAIKVAKEIKAYTKELKQLPREEGRKQARELLVSTGICTKNGKLTKPYRPAKENV